MTDQPEPTAAMPLFHNRIVILDSALHGDLRLAQTQGYGFAAKTNSIPLSLAEFDVAAQHYPIVFTAGAAPQPVVLVGYRAAENLFVEPDGAWRKGAYIPAYVRTYPFVLVESGDAADRLLLGIDIDAACLTTGAGAALFERGKPSAGLEDALKFCKGYRDDLAATRAFAAALATAGLLEERSATVALDGGGLSRLDGFLQIAPDRLKALDDQVWLDWRRRGWIDAIYAHLHSAGRWVQLIEAGG